MSLLSTTALNIESQKPPSAENGGASELLTEPMSLPTIKTMPEAEANADEDATDHAWSGADFRAMLP